MNKEDIYGWKCRLLQINDTIRFLEQQKIDIEQIIEDNSPHNTIAESEGIDLLDSSSQVGEQVGSVGSHNSLKAPLKKSKMAVGSEDEDTNNNFPKSELDVPKVFIEDAQPLTPEGIKKIIKGSDEDKIKKDINKDYE